MSEELKERAFDALCKYGKAWADAEAEAQKKEELRKSYLAELKLASQAKTESAKETEALADATYMEFVEAMVEARRLANIARIEYRAKETAIDVWRTEQATIRAEAGLR